MGPTYILLLWFPSGICCFRQRVADVLGVKETKFGAPCPTGMRALKNWLTWIMIFGSVVVYLAFVFGPNQPVEGLWLYVTGLPFLVFAVALSINAANLWEASRWLIAGVRSNGVKVLHLDPDEAGGLSFIGDMLAKFILYAASVVLFFGALFWFWTSVDPTLPEKPELILIWSVIPIAYLAFIYVLLIQPLRVVRGAMRERRDLLLMEVAHEVQRLESNLPALIGMESMLRAERLKRAHDVYQSIQATYPTLPFSLAWRRGVPVTAIIPLVVGAIPLIVELMDNPVMKTPGSQ